MEIVRRAGSILMEHFDTCQIFVTRHSNDPADYGTRTANFGRGNWFARFGQVKTWVVAEEEELRIEKRKDLEDEG